MLLLLNKNSNCVNKYSSSISAAQFQQSWSYANNVNLLAANANTGVFLHNSGSGIYAGRLAALDIFVSKTSKTKILIANIPINLPLLPTENVVNEIDFAREIKFEVDRNTNEKYDHQVFQENMTLFTIEFFDFSKRLNYNGTICNGDFCCNYDIDVIDSGSQDGKVIDDIQSPNRVSHIKYFYFVAFIESHVSHRTFMR